MSFFCRSALVVFVLAVTHRSPCQADDAADAQKLVDKAIKAMGGSAAVERTRNTIMHDAGTYFGMGNGLPYTGRYVTQLGNPIRYRMEIEGVFVQVINGDKAWIKVQGETSDVTGDALKESTLKKCELG